MLTQAKEFYRKHERWAPAVFFLAGFAFDASVLHRIDEPLVLIQQALYILVSSALIGLELLHEHELFVPPRWLSIPWRYRHAITHFLLGTLLNSYTIFYFKSASALTSLVFMVILVGVLLLNEFNPFADSQRLLDMALVALCTVSYCVSLAPILIGFIGVIPFAAAIAFSLVYLLVYYRMLVAKLPQQSEMLRKQALTPFVAVPAVFVALYFAQLIPPVPLSVNFMGVYHQVEKEAGEYKLSYERPWWKFWLRYDQEFLARPGDVIHCFARIYSPTRFKDELKIRWMFRDPRRGWTTSDVIPFPIQGGREEGYRGVTKKGNYQEGDWRVHVETADGREVGKIRFSVKKDSEATPREFRTELE